MPGWSVMLSLPASSKLLTLQRNIPNSETAKEKHYTSVGPSCLRLPASSKLLTLQRNIPNSETAKGKHYASVGPSC
jgi:hypothetical protein